MNYSPNIYQPNIYSLDDLSNDQFMISLSPFINRLNNIKVIE